MDSPEQTTRDREPRHEATPVIRVFGAMGADGSDGPVNVGGPRQRRLLALLAVRAGTIVDLDWLSEYLWDDRDRPTSTTKSIRTYLHRLRSAMPEAAREWIETKPEGYRLNAPDEGVEHRLFGSLRARATLARQREDPQTALALLDEALALWRGDPFREIEDLEWMSAEIERLRMDRLEMMEERWEAALALGRHTQITGELSAFTTEHADRDRATRQYALALHRSGRTAEALQVIAGHKKILVEEFGLDPSTELAELELALLQGDPSLDVEVEGRPLRGYRLIDQVGVGSYAVVWRAEQPSLGREVAVKQIRVELANDPAFIRSFEAEAQLVARVEHPHAVPLIDFWRDPDSAYLVMRLLRGGTLEQRLADGPLAADEVLALARQVGGVLSAAHALGVIHRDVKPANILFDEHGHSFLGDFGIALDAAHASSIAPEPSGSPAYAAPEQRAGEPVGPEADVYGLAMVLVECLGDVEPALAEILAMGTAADPAARYASVAELIEALETALTGEPEAPPAKVAELGETHAPNPYLGLRAFDDADAAHFFGRERLIDELARRLAADEEVSSRCLIVVGPSGAGKSSVVRAGLLPALRRDRVPGSGAWFTTAMVPGDDPFEALEVALLRVAVNPPPSLMEQLRSDPRGLLRGIRRCLPSDDSRLLLFIDQLEELFVGRSNAYAPEFLEALSIATADPSSPLRLVTTLRADYYDRPLADPSFAPLLGPGTVTVPPLTGDELERAVVEPAAAAGVTYEAGLVARIVAETSRQTAPLPLLQYALSELYDRREGRLLTARAYDELGGLAGALAARAEAIHAQADEPTRGAIRRVFGALTDPGETSADLRRRVSVTDLGSDPATLAVLERYGAARLLTFDHDAATRDPTVEVAHEALLREWPRLVDWLEEDLETLLATAALAAAADRWQQDGRAAEDLLRGVRLKEAARLLDSEEARLRPLDREFIAASRDAELAEAKARRHTQRRQQWLAGAIGLVAVVALIAGSLAVLQRSRADDEARAAAEAEAQTALVTLINRAVDEPDPKLGLLLALEASRRAPGPETDPSLLRALQRLGGGEIVASYAAISSGTCAAVWPGWLAPDGSWQSAANEGVTLMRSLDSGDVTEAGPMPGEDCGDWYADPEGGRRYALAEDRSRLWLGPVDGDWDDPLRLDLRSWVGGGAGLAGDRLLLESPGSVRLVDSVAGGVIGGIISGLDEDPLVLLGPRGQLFAAATLASEDDISGVALYDATDGSELYRTALPAAATALRFDPEHGRLLVGTNDGQLVSILLESGGIEHELTLGDGAVLALGPRQDGRVVAVSGGDPGSVHVVDLVAGPLQTEALDLAGVAGIAIRADGTVATLYRDSRVDILDPLAPPLVASQHAIDPRDVPGRGDWVTIADGSIVFVSPSGLDNVIVDLETAERQVADQRLPDGSRFPSPYLIPVGGGYGAISQELDIAFWRDGQLVDRLDLPTEVVAAAADSEWAGSMISVAEWLGGDDQDIHVIEAGPDGLELLQTVRGQDSIRHFPTSDGGLSVVGTDGVMRVYGPSGDLLDEFDTGVDEIGTWEMAVDEGQRIAYSRPSADGRFDQVEIIDRARGTSQVLPIFGKVEGLEFARDGQLLVIQTADGAVRLRDMPAGITSSIIWDGDGTAGAAPWYDAETDTVWVASRDQFAQLSLDREAWRERACAKVGRDLTAEEWTTLVPGGGEPVSICEPEGA